MTSLNLSASTLFLLLLSQIIFGQDVKFYTDKTEYKIDEKIIVTLEVNVEIDSLQSFHINENNKFKFPKFNNLHHINQPGHSNKVNNRVKHQTTYEYKWTYTLRPLIIGEYKLESPVFYSKGERINSVEAIIKVNKSELDLTELKDYQFDIFRKDQIKPNGTIRLNFNEEFGYLEKQNGIFWVFLRKLTDAELKLLSDFR